MEATFLIDPCSPNADLLEAHLKFHRMHPVQQPASMRMLSKIDAWDDLQRLLTTYAVRVLQGAPPDLPVALQAMQLRVPGAPRKLLKANQVRLSVANRSREFGQPIFLYLHLKSFNKKYARPSYITNLQSKVLPEQLEDDASEDSEQPHNVSAEDTESHAADSHLDELPVSQCLPAGVRVVGPLCSF